MIQTDHRHGTGSHERICEATIQDDGDGLRANHDFGSPEATLHDLVQVSAKLGVEISEPGLHGRINDEGVELLKSLLDSSLKQFAANRAVLAEWLSGETVLTLYRVRWQLELFFKLCKSQFRLAVIGLWRLQRLLCQL